MLLQRLCDYADRDLDLPPAGYQETPVRYVFRLDASGRLIGPPIDTADSANKSTKSGRRRLAPTVKRTVGIRPKLLCDTAPYLLGLGRENDKPARVAEQARQFAEQVRACAEATDAPAVRAAATFLDGLDPTSLPLPTDFDPSANATFQVDGVFPIDLPEVRAWWGSQRAGEEEDGDASASAKDDAPVLPCMVCGRVGPVLLRHPLKVKGIPGGQASGTDLVSANSEVFESYGLAFSTIAPTCPVCAEKYLNALNALLADPATCFRGKGEAYLFWTAEGPAPWLPGALNADSSEDVREMLRAPRTGKWAALDLDATAFYALGLGANSSRAVVRSWLDSTVGAVLRHLERWFALQRMVDREGRPGPPLPLWRLLGATVRDPKKEEPPATLADDLLALALQGRPLPADTLAVAVRRCRAMQGVTHPLAVLIKLALGSQVRPGPSSDIPEEIDRMSALDPESRDPAYVCGRLLAVLEAIQYRAVRSNTTLVDRYYGTASAAPATVYGTLLRNAQNHLSKLEKSPRGRGAGIALSQRLTEVMDLLTEFPTTLTLPQQATFALGYYHQRADDFRAMREHREAGPDDDEANDDA